METIRSPSRTRKSNGSIKGNSSPDKSKYSKSPNRFSLDNQKGKESFSKRVKNKPTKSLSWKKDFVDIIKVESFKRYNLENTHMDPNGKDKVTCSCVVY